LITDILKASALMHMVRSCWGTESVVTTQALAPAADLAPDADFAMIARNAATAMVQRLFFPDAY